MCGTTVTCTGYLHNVTQSLPLGKMLRNMEAELKQGCAPVYR